MPPVAEPKVSQGYFWIRLFRLSLCQETLDSADLLRGQRQSFANLWRGQCFVAPDLPDQFVQPLKLGWRQGIFEPPLKLREQLVEPLLALGGGDVAQHPERLVDLGHGAVDRFGLFCAQPELPLNGRVAREHDHRVRQGGGCDRRIVRRGGRRRLASGLWRPCAARPSRPTARPKARPATRLRFPGRVAFFVPRRVRRHWVQPASSNISAAPKGFGTNSRRTARRGFAAG